MKQESKPKQATKIKKPTESNQSKRRFFSKLSKTTRWSSGLIILAAVVFGSILITDAISNNPVKHYDKSLTQAGYTLVAPLNNHNVFLVNNNGKTVHTWHTDNYGGADTKLLPNGELLRTYQTKNNAFAMGGVGGGIELLDWNGNVKWNYTYATPDATQHHDAIVLPNGDIMFLAWVKKTEQQAIAAGVNPKNLDPKTHTTWSDSVIEVSPTTNKIVWQWNAWDHLVQDYSSSKANYGNVAKNPQLINANYYAYGGTEKPDWLHPNSLDYNAKLNQVMISVREFNEVWVIDHSTTTAQAAGHTGGNSGMGGDLIYRYGNPAAYDHGTVADRTLYLQHNANWIADGLPGAGDVLIFSDGDTDTGHRDYSSVLELKFPETGYKYAKTSTGAYAEPETVWTYAPTGKGSFFSNIMGSAQRLPNGNTLIADAVHGTIREVTPSGKLAWLYKNPIFDINMYDTSGPKTNNIFRAYKYPPNYSAFTGKNLQS